MALIIGSPGPLSKPTKASRVAVQNNGRTVGDAIAATARPAVTNAAPTHRRADVQTLLDIGVAVVRVVDLAIPFA
jgi:hypothetical protein